MEYEISTDYLETLVKALDDVGMAKQQLLFRDNDFDNEDRASLELVIDSICTLIVRHCKRYGNHSL